MEQIGRFVETVVDFLAEGLPISQLSKVDTILICGHHEPQIARHAADIWRNQRESIIVVSGKMGPEKKIPPVFQTEADYFAYILERQEGVPASSIVPEREATNTLQNACFGITEARRLGFDPKSVVVVAVPVLLRRACATVRKQFPEISVCGCPFTMPDHWTTKSRLLRMIEELPRLRAYAQKGDIEPVVIPEEVRIAAQRIHNFASR